MAGNHCDDDQPHGRSTGPSAADASERPNPRLLDASQSMESLDEVRDKVSALLDSWASAEVDALMRDVRALLDNAGPHGPCAEDGCPMA